MIDRVGQRLGNYQLIHLLGEGGFAEVYLGVHIHLGTKAAIKVLHTQLTTDDVDKFRTEARMIAHLSHPHIVRVLEFGIEGKTPFLVMDYAPNGTLRQRHPKGVELLLPTIISYVQQVASALQYAHEEKVIHRDVKPENMLVGRNNDIFLSDFGIALEAQSSRYQITQEMAGTMAYMAPEQIQGKPHPASDQYSLGIVVYEWLSGDRPFHGSQNELMAQHLSALPPSLLEKVPTVPPSVEDTVQTALAKDPKERFSSIQAFASALELATQNIALPSIVQPLEINSHTISLDPAISADVPNQLLEPTVTSMPPSELELSVSTAVEFSNMLQPRIKAPSSLFSSAATYSNAHVERDISGSSPLSTGKIIPLPKKRSRKRSITIFILVTLLNVAALAFLWTQLLTPSQNTTQGSSQTNTNDPLIGHPAPDFTLDALNVHPDAPISLASFKGKPIMLNIWNSTCLPCMDEAHLLQSLWQRVKSQGVVFIGIDFQDLKGDGLSFLKKYSVTYPNVLDVSGSTAISYGVTATPETLFINRQGVVVSRVISELTEQSFQSNLQLITR